MGIITPILQLRKEAQGGSLADAGSPGAQDAERGPQAPASSWLRCPVQHGASTGLADSLTRLTNCLTRSHRAADLLASAQALPLKSPWGRARPDCDAQASGPCRNHPLSLAGLAESWVGPHQVPSHGAAQAPPLVSSLCAGSGWPIVLSGSEQTSPSLAPLSIRFSCVVLGSKSALGTHRVYYICRNDTHVDKRGDSLGGNLKAQGGPVVSRPASPAPPRPGEPASSRVQAAASAGMPLPLLASPLKSGP